MRFSLMAVGVGGYDLKPEVIERVLNDRALDDLIARLAGGQTPLAADGVWGSSAPLIAAAVHHRLKRPILYVSPHLEEADRARDDLELFLGRTPLLFPAWESVPSQDALADEVQNERVRVCRLLQSNGGQSEQLSAVVAPVQGLMQAVPKPALLDELSRELSVGGPSDPQELARWLLEQGFERLDQVEAPGDFAVRGGIVDVYGPSEEWPVRLEFFGDRIESIRCFDPATQRSTRRLERVRLAATPPLDLRDIESTTHLLHYLPPETIVVWDDLREIGEQAELFYDRLDDVTGLYPLGAIRRAARRRSQLELARFGPVAKVEPVRLKIESLQRFEEKADRAVLELCALAERDRVSLYCDNEAEKQRISELVTEQFGKLPAGMELRVGMLHQGFRWASLGLVLVGHHEVFHRYQRRRKIRKLTAGRPIESFLDLDPGDLVVHVAHGIARYRGMEPLSRDGRTEDFLRLEFADRAILHVPARSIDLVQKYIGAFRGRPALSKLGGVGWQRAKQRVGQAVTDLATELLELQARRETVEGTAYPADTEWQREFEGSFIFEETEDQIIVGEQLKRDLHKARPMDRLLCGDVGYGKTELAMRAAFKVVEYGKQVAVLVPTTILAEQHHATFRERMAEYPFVIECLSRFRSAKEQADIIRRTRKGQVDILIGTHRLLSKDVGFADLGLIVIDEEQRFGVEHKERLKLMRTAVDVLTMTATPIPRTLHMSLVGLRDISSLATPPLDRRSIVTEVCRYDPRRIRQAIIRELNRRGQVYFVHNRVHNIDRVAERIRKIVPEARVLVGHGQMAENELEEVMLRFIRGQADVLVCTTIIESGVDIPNVNTIFVNDADRFGLADLHQLRGRVGRYKHRAYAYLLLSPERQITKTAARRLKAIEEYSELGAGFRIAMRDLEIRGAGNLLGPEQSGHIAAVGYELYCQLLEDAVRRLRDEPTDTALRGAHVELEIVGSIPRSYIASERLRLESYRRLARCRSVQQIRELEQDLRDAFGRPPEEVEILLQLAQIRLLAARWKVSRIIRMGPDLVFSIEELALAEALFQGAPGTARLPDPQTVHWRLPPRYLETPTLLAVMRGLLDRPVPELASER